MKEFKLRLRLAFLIDFSYITDSFPGLANVSHLILLQIFTPIELTEGSVNYLKFFFAALLSLDS